MTDRLIMSFGCPLDAKNQGTRRIKPLQTQGMRRIDTEERIKSMANRIENFAQFIRLQELPDRPQEIRRAWCFRANNFCSLELLADWTSRLRSSGQDLDIVPQR